MNLQLMQRGFPLTIIRAENVRRAEYFHALAEADATEENPTLDVCDWREVFLHTR